MQVVPILFKSIFLPHYICEGKNRDILKIETTAKRVAWLVILVMAMSF